MYAILKNLRDSVSIDNLEEYVTPFLNGFFFQKHGSLRVIKIIQLYDKSGSPVERHALIRVSSEKALIRLIKGLNKQTFTDDEGFIQRVRAAEFVTRQIMNDRRSYPGKLADIKHELRKGERRRLGLNIITVSEKYFDDGGPFSKRLR
ncbi:MAG: hypothetical protein ACU836_05325 [Gammaproteobacteria bacterium]